MSDFVDGCKMVLGGMFVLLFIFGPIALGLYVAVVGIPGQSAIGPLGSRLFGVVTAASWTFLLFLMFTVAPAQMGGDHALTGDTDA